MKPPLLRDETLALLREGYAFLPTRRRRAHCDVIALRLLGRRVLACCGPRWARAFYDESSFERKDALPGVVLSTLFGYGAVHTLDGTAHRQRKELFLEATAETSARRLTDEVARAWEVAARRWEKADEIDLLTESAKVLADAACRWADIAVAESETRSTARDMVSMIDGFATLGPRHWRARAARRRQEHLLETVIEAVRRGEREPYAGSPLGVVASHRDLDGALLPARIAAVELINLIRPTIAVSWFVSYAAHTLAIWPAQGQWLRDGSEPEVRAFAQELRRWYPFAPFLGAIARTKMEWEGQAITPGRLVLLDVYGQNHLPSLWERPERFEPQRFIDSEVDPFTLIPQGGGDPATGHRCPGEDITMALLETVLPRLASLEYDVPTQDLSISLARIPARVASGMVLTHVREKGES